MNTELQRQQQAFKQARARIEGAGMLRKEASLVSMGPARPAIRPFSPFIPIVAPKPFKRDWLHVASVETIEPLITVKKIQRDVCDEFGIEHREFLSRDLVPKLVLPRHISMYLSRLFTNKSFPEIARLHNRLDHSTALYAFRKIDVLVHTDDSVTARVSALKSKLEAMRDA